jgi:hypothetical protein
MSRKMILTLAAAATVAVATLASQSADARGFGGGGFGGGGFGRGFGGGAVAARGFGGGGMGRISTPIVRTPTAFSVPGRGGHPIIPILNPRNPIHPVFPGHPGWWWWAHHHDHWIFRDGRWIEEDVAVEEAPAVATGPGPCTCLTKTYTPSGLVVFADVCTKESASAVPMSVVPTAPNYAGRTYEDYLAANPQSAPPQAANPPTAPQKN